MPEDRKVYSADRATVAYWFVSGQDEDMYDDTTRYQVVVAADGVEEVVARFYRHHSVSRRADRDDVDGKQLASVEFEPDGESLRVHYVDGSSDVESLAPPKPIVWGEGGERIPPEVAAYLKLKEEQKQEAARLEAEKASKAAKRRGKKTGER